MSIRVYLPLTSRQLAALVADRRLAGPLPGHAVTDALRAEWPDGDDEQWEYAAMAAAAETSWLDRGEGDRPRRHVVAVDVAAAEPISADDITAVTVVHDVVWRNVASAHVDVEDLAGTPDDDGDGLAWFATQEIEGLV